MTDKTESLREHLANRYKVGIENVNLEVEEVEDGQLKAEASIFIPHPIEYVTFNVPIPEGVDEDKFMSDIDEIIKETID